MFLVDWLWQGFLHFYDTIPLASNENTALKLEVKHEHGAMLEQEHALGQPQNEAFNRKHHFDYSREDESGFSVKTISKGSKHIPSASLTAFINCSVLLPDLVKPPSPGHWCPNAGKERATSIPCQLLCWKEDLWSWAELGNIPSGPWVMWYREVQLLLCGTVQPCRRTEQGHEWSSAPTDPTSAPETYPAFKAGTQLIWSTVSPKARRMKTFWKKKPRKCL